ncbi:chromosome-associated kinesin KIF4A [Nasonia vitripennis]|uniref:Kinesin motor domain-containing protein n=1 Tax=Nasonia vitripennis TaxID=7425 RepID=A0A7M7G6U6_NASVI|nr:chromosome-associated kinesin KIF4A [Nasonia vitripennis]
MNNDLVKVAVRIRPLIQSEIDKGCQTCLNVDLANSQIQVQPTDKAFTFNYVFSPEISQETFYNTAIKDMISNIFEGYNVTILAYGQTGSGKTFSMGTNYNPDDSNCGVIPRAVNDIFEQIKDQQDLDFKVTVAFMELYNEQLYDLLSKKPRNQSIVDIREDTRGVKIVGMSEVIVTNTQETLQYLADGSSYRATGATAMNLQSSRSHAIFTITVQQQKKDQPNTAKYAKFHLVDLAGSERSKKTQATGERFKEGVNINKGLLALGNVISQLGEGAGSSYIGYRDSKLTRLLQDSLGGNSVTLMIACVSPADYNIDETTSTLRYADRAKKIKNKPIINQDPRVAEINNLKKIITELRSAMMNGEGGGNCCPPEHMKLEEKNQSLQRKLRGLTETLNNNLVEVVHMHEIANLAEQSQEQLKVSIGVILDDCENLLKEFEIDPTDLENHKVKLENICLKILNLQKDQQKAIEILVTHESLEESSNNISTNSTSDSVNENSVHNETYDLDEKHEEHTLQQAERFDEVQYINKQLAIKEELVSNLLKNSSQIVEYEKELEEMELEIKNLQAEKEELMQQLRNVQKNNASAKLAETRRKKVQELEKKIAEMSRKCLEQNKIIKNKEKSDMQVKNLANEIATLKQTKVKLIRNMRTETDNFNKWKRAREQEIFRLKDQDRKRLNQITRMQAEHNKQKNVFKRKMEEAEAIHKRLKNALDLQSKAAQRREQTANAKGDIHSWVTQELEVLLSTFDAERTLDKLKKDKASFANQLAELQLQNQIDDSILKQAQISEIMEYVEVRNAQIKEMEKNIKESNQENRAKTRWHVISSMADAKEALKTLFEITISYGKEQILLKSQFDELKETCSKLQVENEKYQIRESNSKLRKECLGLPVNTSDQTDKDQLIQDQQKQIELYKQEIERLKNKVLTEKDLNVVEKKSKPKAKAIETVMIEESFCYTDESIVDDDENDPDWKATPLFSRIQKIENATKNLARESKVGLKRSSNGEIKCSCKTSCTSRLCSCRKNEVSCQNCNCNPEICKNRDGDSTRRMLFTDADNMKKQKLENET